MSERAASDDEPLAVLAFKLLTDPYVGHLTFLRVYSGVLKSGGSVLNATKGTKERIGRLLKMHANKREEIDEAYAGDIVAAVGLRHTTTGDTLCDERQPITLEQLWIPQPVIDIAIEPKTKADQDKLGMALSRIAAEDPSFRVQTEPETGETIISGMGELHLEIIVDRLIREFKVDARMGRPQVSYRETITESARAEGRFVRQSGGRGQYGHVWLELEPLAAGTGVVFENKIVGGVSAQGIYPRGGTGGQGGGRDRHHGLPHGGPAHSAGGRHLPRGGLLGAGLPDRRFHGLQRRGQARPGRCSWSRSWPWKW